MQFPNIKERIYMYYTWSPLWSPWRNVNVYGCVAFYWPHKTRFLLSDHWSSHKTILLVSNTSSNTWLWAN